MIRRSRLILIGALLVIFGIFLFAFVGIEGENQGGKEYEENVYNMKRRFPPEEVVERDRKTLPKGWPEEGVDVVYFWTRPMVEARMAEFEIFFREAMKDENAFAEDMSGDFAQMQYYFARGVEAFAPWFRNLVVVIPDNVPTRPFNESDSRVRYVRHSQIVPEEVLPLFNWRAILLHLVKKDEALSTQFVFTDDLTFPISYISPTSLRNRKGEIQLPIANAEASMPLQDAESELLNLSAETIRLSLLENRDRLGFTWDEIDKIAKVEELPKFENRGWTLVDRQVLADLDAICHDALAASSLHRLRQKDTLDIIYMHHTFIYWMRQLYRTPSHAQTFVRKFDAQKDGFLGRDELISLAEALGYEKGEIGKWIASLFTTTVSNETASIQLDQFLKTSNPAFLDIVQTAVRPQFKYALVPSPTVALELRHKIPMRLSVVMPILKSGIPTSLWAGPRLLGPSGSEARDAVENFLWFILRNRHSSLESVYKPPKNLGLYIGVAYFSTFLFGTWFLSKCLLRSPKRETSD